MKASEAKLCELCNRQADLYCTSDKAFLCFHCDFTVHNANFLVARHLRRLICSSCNSLSGPVVSGHRSPLVCRTFCRSCSPEDDADSISGSSSSSSTLSSACISTTETTRRRGKPEVSARLRRGGGARSGVAEGIFGNWCKKLGQNGNSIVSRASDAMEVCTEKLGKALPYRVSLAASFWFGLRYCGNATRQNLRALENISGVPVKLIVAVELKLEHLLRVRASRRDLEEGWAECSV